MNSFSFKINFARKLPEQNRRACVPWLLFEAAETTSSHHPADSSSSQSSFNSSRDSAAIVRPRVASLWDSPETGTHGNVQPRMYTLYIRGYFIMGTTRTHDGWMWRWRREGRGGRSVVRNTMRYGSQKIRDPDMRARHVSRWINKGAWCFSPLRLLVFFSLSEICCESVGTLTREDQPRFSVITPSHRPPRKYSFRGFPFVLCSLQIIVGNLFIKISFCMKATFYYLKIVQTFIFVMFRYLINIV